MTGESRHRRFWTLTRLARSRETLSTSFLSGWLAIPCPDPVLCLSATSSVYGTSSPGRGRDQASKEDRRVRRDVAPLASRAVTLTGQGRRRTGQTGQDGVPGTGPAEEMNPRRRQHPPIPSCRCSSCAASSSTVHAVVLPGGSQLEGLEQGGMKLPTYPQTGRDALSEGPPGAQIMIYGGPNR
ncbi:hypothetical protein F5X68DRAFT_43670 [Plectosphaerella plurivora]|uniref:Uncharacterized protein n=1 Tax=Plectosphaerella plurivora TaxID=936078 RepID=A0A9P8V459_9PEZI|nr:hypothetical protein F5X68DRAFT_43670 [Plectosphaerella plurivora]